MISKGIKFILTLTFSAKTLTQKHGAIHIALLALIECVLWDNCADFFFFKCTILLLIFRIAAQNRAGYIKNCLCSHSMKI